MRSLGNQNSIPAPRVFHTSQHFTMEGRHPVKTYGSSKWVEGETVYFLNDTTQIEELVKKVAQQPILGIKLTIEDGPHPPFVERMPQELINKVQREADKNGLEVFAHVSDNIELEMAINADIKNLVHFTGVDIDFQKDSVLLSKIYKDSIDWVTTLMLDKSFLYPLYPEWIENEEIQNIFSEDELSAIDDPGYIFRANDYIGFMKEYLKLDTIDLKDVIKFQVDDIKILMDNGVNMVLGTDTGNEFIFPGYGLHEEMQLFELGGIDQLQIIKMATLNAAKMMKSDLTLGSIEQGKTADMILLDKNPLESISNTLSISTVIKGGVIQKRIKE
jgi:imidazolonepropionase-like amidohydrolase